MEPLNPDDSPEHHRRAPVWPAERRAASGCQPPNGSKGFTAVTGSAHEPGGLPPAHAAEQMREATERLRDQAWMFAPMIAMVSPDIALRSGAVTCELDREARVLVMTCERHAVQDAVPLDRRSMPQQVHDFLVRHQACERSPGSRRVPPQRMGPVTPRH